MARNKTPQWQQASELVKKVPGLHQYRRQLILALCQQGGTSAFWKYAEDPDAYGSFIIKVANRILERTEQK